MNAFQPSYDVVIIGAGLAGLTLARQLLLESEDLKILNLDRAEFVPIKLQKVGESNVQVQGHYLARVLDMEVHLFHEQVMKYNLRFMWKGAERTGERFEDFGHSYIRKFSNIACYQLDRNKLEEELVRLNREEERYTLIEGAKVTETDIHEGGGHTVRFERDGETHETTAGWLVDSTGRNRKLATNLGTKQECEIRHSSSFFWTEGTVNIEKLTDSDRHAIRKRPERKHLGHLPFWLATNHFCGEGFWFWVIPLHSRTSFGLVYDNKLVDGKQVSTKEGLLAWLYERFPLFEPELSKQEIIDFQVLRNYSHNCENTISNDQWAMSGFAGRFTDPLYSPGGDMIAIHNTLITDAILTEDKDELASKVRSYEMMMRTIYKSFIPTFHLSYNALGDQEAFSMKYTWELSVYFGFYVFPFINDMFTDRLFLVAYMRRFGQLGPINKNFLVFISEFYEWKKREGLAAPDPQFFDFTEVEALNRAESTFYEVGVDTNRAIEILEEQLVSLREMALYFVAHMCARVAGNPDLLRSRTHVESVDLSELEFDAEAISARWNALPVSGDDYKWTICPKALELFWSQRVAASV
jgi:flavin-dependent dehydrogenase